MGRWIVLFDNGKPCGVFEYDLDLHIKLLGHHYLTVITVKDCEKNEAVKRAVWKNRFGTYDQLAHLFDGIDIGHMRYNYFIRTCRRIFLGVLLKKIEENGRNVTAAARDVGLNKKSVYRLLHRMPIKHDYMPWTEAEEDYLKENKDKPYGRIAQQLGRSANSVESKANRMGLYREKPDK